MPPTRRLHRAPALVIVAAIVALVVANPSPMVKQIGLGLAVGVFIDALIVRMFLVPSLMRRSAVPAGGCRTGWT